MTFAQPNWLFLLLLLPLLMVAYYRTLGGRHVSLKVSNMQALKGGKTWVVYARYWLQWLRWIVMALLIVALARPQLLWVEDTKTAEAIDLMLTVDLSVSMLSQDFQPDRLAVVKELSNEFIQQRSHDRIGLTVFAGAAFNQCPLTTDHRILKAFVNNMQVGRLPDGTAIGMGLATAVQHLKDSSTVSKAIILMTDGENNVGSINPAEGAAMAQALGIRLYVVAIGEDGPVLSPVARKNDGSYVMGSRTMSLDTAALATLAATAGGKTFRAKTAEDLQAVYEEINQLEKNKITVKNVRRVTELFFWFLNAAISLMVLELLLRWGPLRVITI